LRNKISQQFLYFSQNQQEMSEHFPVVNYKIPPYGNVEVQSIYSRMRRAVVKIAWYSDVTAALMSWFGVQTTDVSDDK
jgi:hypothetical protein